MAVLPLELVCDILCRLPVKPLMRFRCVSKGWCFLIDSKDFIKLHLNQSIASQSNQSIVFGGLSLYLTDVDPLVAAEPINPPFYYKSVDSISNACNGIVLVMSEPPVLWNPFARKYKILPNCKVNESEGSCYSKTTYGLGYVSKTDDYKVVTIVEYRSTTTHVWMRSETRIYSLRANSWKKIEGFPYPMPFLKGKWRVHVNGALHTLVEDANPFSFNRSLKVMAFDVETETHYEVLLPPDVQVTALDNVRLDVLDGYLCFMGSSRSRVTIWVLREYGNWESWKKLFAISKTKIGRDDDFKPLVYSKDGSKVLMNCNDKKLVWFDLKKRRTEDVDISGLPFVFYAEHCVQSLINPDALDGDDEVKKFELVKKYTKIGSKKRDKFLSEGFKLVL